MWLALNLDVIKATGIDWISVTRYQASGCSAEQWKTSIQFHDFLREPCKMISFALHICKVAPTPQKKKNMIYYFFCLVP